MGRTKYSPEAVNSIMAAFVTAAKEIIDEEGIDGASIRRVSAKAGYSSGTLYLYFEDMEELVAMALISSLHDYTLDMVKSDSEDLTPRVRYFLSWELFCKHGLAHPREYLKLFFGPKANNIDAIAKRYYELFPDDLEDAEGLMLSMLARGDLRERNRTVLLPLAADLGLSDRETEIANDLTIAFFQGFLMHAAEQPPAERDTETLTRRFIDGARFILRCS